MKKLILIAAVALMALPAAAQVQEAFPSYIQVNGRAEKEITPDEFYLSVIINERDSKGKISVFKCRFGIGIRSLGRFELLHGNSILGQQFLCALHL